MASLPVTNLTTTAIQAALGVTDNNIEDLCYNTAINQWSLRKPAAYAEGEDALSGAPPLGKADDASGYRLGDFRGYNHEAVVPIRFDEEIYSAQIYNDVPPLEAYSFYPLFLDNLGEIPPTINYNGFEPEYVFDYSTDDMMRIRAELWQNDEVVSVGEYVEIENPGWGTPILTGAVGSPVDVTGLEQGTYVVRGRQQFLNGDEWQDAGFINGGNSWFVLETVEQYSCQAYIAQVAQNTKAVYVEVTAINPTVPLNLSVKIERLDENDSVLFEGQLILVEEIDNATEGSNAIYINTTGVGRAKVTVSNNETGYVYSIDYQAE